LLGGNASLAKKK